MSTKVSRTVQKVFSLPKCIIYHMMGFGHIKISGLQRWERGFKIYFDGGYFNIGSGCNFRHDAQLRALDGGVVRIGDKTFMNNNVCITARNKITIGNNVKIANNVVVIDHDHDYMNGNKGYKVGSVVIEDGVWIGANAVILKDTFIGKNSVIGAGSVVKGVVPSNTVFGGEMASIIKKFELL
ncbi:MAG: acyltransferase [Lachnospiraceae bacterium]|nr:acyltransferase [Lachnospiraceae bacterium]